MISLIAAIDKNGAIGAKGALPWHLPADLKFFKDTTSGKIVIMGRKTFDSVGRKALPNRKNIVITRQADLVAPGCEVASSLDQALEIARTKFAYEPQKEELFIVGGSQVYADALPIADRIYLTEVDTVVDGDTFFPTFSKNEWVVVSDKAIEADDKNRFRMRFVTLDRRR